MANIVTRKIENQSTVQYLERLNFEVTSRKDLISFMIERGMDISGESFKVYQEDYRKLYAEYELAKQAFERTEVQTISPYKKFAWNLDFGSCEVEITEVKA